MALGGNFSVVWPFKPCYEVNATSPFTVCTLTTSVIFSVALFGNSLTLLALFTCPEIRKLSNASLASLAVADILVVTVDVIYALVPGWSFMITEDGPYEIRLFLMSLLLAPFVSSSLHVWIMAVERYFAILHPFKYAHSFTGRNVAKSLSCIWTLSFILPMVPVIVCGIAKATGNAYLRESMWRHSSTFTLGCIWVVYFGEWFEMTVMYVQIYRAARKSGKMTPKPAASTTNNLLSNPTHTAGRRAFAIGFSVVMVYVIAWAPFLTIQTFISVRGIKEGGWLNLANYSVKLGVMNSALNFVLYAAVCCNFRKAFKKILCRPRQLWASPQQSQ